MGPAQRSLLVPAHMRRLGRRLAPPVLCGSATRVHLHALFATWRMPSHRVVPQHNLPSNVARTTASCQSAQLRVASCPLPPCQSHLAPERVSTPALPPHRAVTSLSPSSRRPRYFYAIHGYKRRPPLHLVHNCAMSASGKPSPPHHLCFFPSAPSVPSRITPPLSLCVGPGAPQVPGVASSPVQVTPSLPVSFRLLVARPPSYELVLLAMSGGFTMRLGCSR
jgi:hypothetical protein